MAPVVAFLARKPLLLAAAVDATFASWVLSSGMTVGTQTAAILACKAWTVWFASSLTTSNAAAEAWVEQAAEVAQERGRVAGKVEGVAETTAAIAALADTGGKK